MKRSWEEWTWQSRRQEEQCCSTVWLLLSFMLGHCLGEGFLVSFIFLFLGFLEVPLDVLLSFCRVFEAIATFMNYVR